MARFLADAIVVFHFAFVLFVGGGGLLVLRWPRLAWLHVPAALWGVLVEYTGIICPLTPLENRLRVAAGQSAYQGGFIQRHMVRLLYPEGLTRGIQVAIGCFVVLLNVAVYVAIWQRRRSGRAFRASDHEGRPNERRPGERRQGFDSHRDGE